MNIPQNQVVSRQAGIDKSAISIRIVRLPGDRNAILHLRDAVYVHEQGRILRKENVEDSIFGQFEKYSTYFIAYDDDLAIATLRVTLDSEKGLPCDRGDNLQHLRSRGRLVEFGNFICLPDYRIRGIGLHLMNEALCFSVVCLNATHVLADIFADETSSLGPKFFFVHGFDQVGELYYDERFDGSPCSMVVALDIKDALKSKVRMRAVEEFRRRHPV